MSVSQCLDEQGLLCKHTPGIVYYRLLITSLKIRLNIVAVKTILTTTKEVIFFFTACVRNRCALWIMLNCVFMFVFSISTLFSPQIVRIHT